MTPIRSFAELRARVAQRPPLRLAVAGGADMSVRDALAELMADGLISSAVVAGESGALRQLYCDFPSYAVTLLATDTPAQVAVDVVRSGAADVLVKGRVDTTTLMRAVLDRQHGLPRASVLSNVTVAQMPSLSRLIAVTDNGIVPRPNLAQKRAIITNTTPLFRGLGRSPVQVAVVAASEKVSAANAASLDARTLAEEGAMGILPGFEIGGPMGYDVAICPAAARAKGLSDLPAAGAADLLLFAEIDAANAVAKSWKFHGNARTGSVVLGASAPILLNSRSDSADRRVNALLLAAAVLHGADRRQLSDA